MTIHFADVLREDCHCGKVARLEQFKFLNQSPELAMFWAGMTQTRTGFKPGNKEQIAEWTIRYLEELNAEKWLKIANAVHPAMDVTFVEGRGLDHPPVRHALRQVLGTAKYPYIGRVDGPLPKPKEMENFGKSLTLRNLGVRLENITLKKGKELLAEGRKFPEVFTLVVRGKKTHYQIIPLSKWKSEFDLQVEGFAKYFNGSIADEVDSETIDMFFNA